jgi:hypothetical protein
LTLIRDIPRFLNNSSPYQPDDGPLSEEYLVALRADVAKHFPRGKLIGREDLFK